jgi:4-alpha-glucanotransferase
MPFPRASGILLHPTSLASRGGIGDFGPSAYAFADFLASARQGLWQVLPLGPLGYGNSPYSSTSAFAGNPLLISLERLADRGWIDRARVDALPDGSGPVDYPAVFHNKLPLLFEAARNFLGSAGPKARARYERFCAQNQWWLDDFVLFAGLRARFKLESWNRWPRELTHRDPAAVEKAHDEMLADLDRRRVIEFFFHEQWRALRSYCAHRSIRVVGDIAIFVNFDSADVWTHPDLFRLNSELNPEVVAGVPPDFFSAEGQRWGNPLYRWDVMQEREYSWWIDRLRWATHNFDYVRLDHFRGFSQFWEIPAMAVLQFAFGNDGAHVYLPHTYTADKVVYTGTHDNDTLLGWWESSATEHERRQVEAYVGRCEDGVNWAMIRAASSSVASLCLVPLQDALGLGKDARMNVPSRAEGNWGWRFDGGALRPELAKKLAELAEVSDRLPQPFAASSEPASSNPDRYNEDRFNEDQEWAA